MDLERTVLVSSLIKANTTIIWRLNRCIHELAEASRYWYLKDREGLCKLSGKFSKLDQGIFYFYKGPEMIGIVVRFVDNLLWARTSTFYQVISKLRKIFHIESENQMISIISE